MARTRAPRTSAESQHYINTGEQPRERRPRLPHRYYASFCRGRDVRGFTVHGWNKDDAYVEARKALEASGEDLKAWWYIGADRAR